MRTVVYHSHQWALLVEMGWSTYMVETQFNGDQIATMIHCPQPRTSARV